MYCDIQPVVLLNEVATPHVLAPNGLDARGHRPREVQCPVCKVSIDAPHCWVLDDPLPALRPSASAQSLRWRRTGSRVAGVDQGWGRAGGQEARVGAGATWASDAHVAAAMVVKLVVDMWLTAGPAASLPLALLLLRRCCAAPQPALRRRAFDLLANLQVPPPRALHCWIRPLPHRAGAGAGSSASASAIASAGAGAGASARACAGAGVPCSRDYSFVPPGPGPQSRVRCVPGALRSRLATPARLCQGAGRLTLAAAAGGCRCTVRCCTRGTPGTRATVKLSRRPAGGALPLLKVAKTAGRTHPDMPAGAPSCGMWGAGMGLPPRRRPQPRRTRGSASGASATG